MGPDDWCNDVFHLSVGRYTGLSHAEILCFMKTNTKEDMKNEKEEIVTDMPVRGHAGRVRKPRRRRECRSGGRG